MPRRVPRRALPAREACTAPGSSASVADCAANSGVIARSCARRMCSATHLEHEEADMGEGDDAGQQVSQKWIMAACPRSTAGSTPTWRGRRRRPWPQGQCQPSRSRVLGSVSFHLPVSRSTVISRRRSRRQLVDEIPRRDPRTFQGFGASGFLRIRQFADVTPQPGGLGCRRTLPCAGRRRNSRSAPSSRFPGLVAYQEGVMNASMP